MAPTGRILRVADLDIENSMRREAIGRGERRIVIVGAANGRLLKVLDGRTGPRLLAGGGIEASGFGSRAHEYDTKADRNLRSAGLRKKIDEDSTEPFDQNGASLWAMRCALTVSA